MAVDVPRSVIQKLMFFTVAMVALPLLTFFGAQQFSNNTLVNGFLAAAMANIVLIGYIIVALTEDVSKLEQSEKEKKEK